MIIISDSINFNKVGDEVKFIHINFKNKYPIKFFMALSLFYYEMIDGFTITDNIQKKYAKLLKNKELSKLLNCRNFFKKYDRGYKLFLNNQSIGYLYATFLQFFQGIIIHKYLWTEMEICQENSVIEFFINFYREENFFSKKNLETFYKFFIENDRKHINLLFDFEKRFPENLYMNFHILKEYPKKEIKIIDKTNDIELILLNTGDKENAFLKENKKNIYYLYLNEKLIQSFINKFDLWYLGELKDSEICLNFKNEKKEEYLRLIFWLDNTSIPIFEEDLLSK